VRLTGKPKSESLMRLKHLEFFFKDWKPRRDKMKILEANPLSLSGSLFNFFNGDFILSTTHGNGMITGSSDNLISKFL